MIIYLHVIPPATPTTDYNPTNTYGWRDLDDMLSYINVYKYKIHNHYIKFIGIIHLWAIYIIAGARRCDLAKCRTLCTHLLESS